MMRSRGGSLFLGLTVILYAVSVFGDVVSEWNAMSGGLPAKVVYGKGSNILAVMDLQTGVETEILTISRFTYAGWTWPCPAWSPDGTRIAWYSMGSSEEPTPPFGFGVGVCNADGSSGKVKGSSSVHHFIDWWDDNWVLDIDMPKLSSTLKRWQLDANNNFLTSVDILTNANWPLIGDYREYFTRSGNFITCNDKKGNVPTGGNNRPLVYDISSGNQATYIEYEAVADNRSGCTISMRPDGSGVYMFNNMNHDNAEIRDAPNGNALLQTLPGLFGAGMYYERWANDTDYITFSRHEDTSGGQSEGYIRKLSDPDLYVYLGNNVRTLDLYIGSGGPTDSITVTSPDGGETWTPLGTETVTWSFTGTVGDVEIEVSTDNGSSWTTLIASTPNDGTEDVTAPDVNSIECLVRVSEASDGTPSDTSNATFTIGTAPPSLDVTYPVNGTVWTGNTSETITWDYTGTVANLEIILTVDDWASYTTIVADTPCDGSETIIVPNTPGNLSCQVIVRTHDTTIEDWSNGRFTIVAGSESITVTSPDGGENWTALGTETVTWTTTGTVGNVKIELSIDGGSTWTDTLAADTANDGSEVVTVPDVNSTLCRIKISEASDGVPVDTSDADFTISGGPDTTPPGVSVTAVVIDGSATDAEMNPPIVTVAGTNLGPVATFSQEVTLTGGSITVTAEDSTNTTTVILDVTVP